jgi:hypothetical protein
MAKLSKKRREQLKEAQKIYREKKRLGGEKQLNVWIKEGANLITNNQNLITNNQNVITNNQDLISNQLEQIKAIVDKYENESLCNNSPRWQHAKRLIGELKQALDKP